MSESNANTERPVPLSLLVAERIYQDRETGKWIVAGIFSNINAPGLPVVQDTLEVFFQVTNVSTPVDLHLKLEHAESGGVLLDAGGTIKSNSPLEVIPQRIVLRRVPFNRSGKYWVQLVSGGEILMQVPLYVRLVQAPQQQQPPPNPQSPHDN
jgi:Family of unknown function (DUF6941)